MKWLVQSIIGALWIAALTVFAASLLTFLVLYRRNILDPEQWWSPASLAGGVGLYFISGWGLIPLPFALAAIIAELFPRRESSSEDASLAKSNPHQAPASWYKIACGGLAGGALGVAGAICWRFLDPYDFEQSKLAIGAGLPVVGVVEGAAFAFGIFRVRRRVEMAGPLGWFLKMMIALSWTLLALIVITSLCFLAWIASGPSIKWG
jgi:hypothetical protein